MSGEAVLRGALTLAVHPVARGMGWVVFRGPAAPHDWGTTFPRRRELNSACLQKLEHLLARLHPETLVLEHAKRPGAAETPRITRLYKAMAALAEDRGVAVAVYTRNEVRTCFASVGAVSRQEIAEAVARHVEVLAHLLPQPRKKWESECQRMSLFSAAALAITHYQLEHTQPQ